MPLSVVVLMTYISFAQCQCTQYDFCHVSNASGTSNNSSVVYRPPHLPNCLSLCSQSDSCFATTHGPVRETCELHWESDGSRFFTLQDDPRKSLWYRKPKGRNCAKVGNPMGVIVLISYIEDIFPTGWWTLHALQRCARTPSMLSAATRQWPGCTVLRQVYRKCQQLSQRIMVIHCSHVLQLYAMRLIALGPHLLTWIKFNPSMHRRSHV